MNLGRYRRVIAAPKVGWVLLVTLGDRLPKYMAVLALTLHCVQNLHRGYGAAGTLIAVVTLGDIVAAPVVGRFVDRWGVRPTVVVGGLGQTAFFLSVPFLDYNWLLVVGFIRAFAPVPTNRLARQALSTLVPKADLRTALAMDSIGMEVAMMIGPALAVLTATRASSSLLFFAVAGALFVSAAGWFWINPSLQASEDSASASERSWRDWLNPHLLVVLFCSIAVGLVLSGTDVGIVASTRELDQLDWAGVVITLWCAASLLGGFAYGAVRKPPGLAQLVFLLSLSTLLAGCLSAVVPQWWMVALALVPAGLFCAPSLTAATEQANEAVRESARGQAISLQNAALSTGIVLGSPLAGFATDQGGQAAWGFGVVAVGGILAAVVTSVARSASRTEDLAKRQHRDPETLEEQTRTTA
ncbi:MFS transporter [Streptomyces hyaluromycini]|uniref:MFS transporter n=1 Tax=Streptomyces hyaluromycini TaxID=1377993 RepID=UPI0011AE690C|nr:MFS transporter [Streptomyces hyaluromycini]